MPSTICAPSASQLRRQHAPSRVALVPTGMKTGVCNAPCAVCSTPARASPSRRRSTSKSPGHRIRHRVAEASRSGSARRSPRGTARASRSTPANAITSASSVERGRWKLVTSAPTARNAVAGRDEEPAAALRAARRRSPNTVSSTRTDGRADRDHPAAAGAARASIAPAAASADRVGLGVDRRARRGRPRRPAGRCRGRRPASPRRPRAAPAARPQRGGEVQAGGRRGGRAGLACVDGLVAARGRPAARWMYGGSGISPLRSSARSSEPASVSGVTRTRPSPSRSLDPQAEPAGRHRLARAEPRVGPRQRLPGAVAQRLQQQQLDRAAGRPRGRAAAPAARGCR